MRALIVLAVAAVLIAVAIYAGWKRRRASSLGEKLLGDGLVHTNQSTHRSLR